MSLSEVVSRFPVVRIKKDPLPNGASRDVRFFHDGHRRIPVTAGVMVSCGKSGSLVDCPGAEMMLVDWSPQGEVLDGTWAALCVVGSQAGAVTYRAFRDSLFAKVCKSSQVDLSVHGGDPPGRCDPQLARAHCLASFRPGQMKVVVSGDDQKLHRWAIERLRRRIKHYCAVQ